MTTRIEQHRIGRIRISRQLLEFDRPALRFILQMLLIVDVRYIDAASTIEYIAYCDRFDPVEEGALIPFYDVSVTQHYADADRIDPVGSCHTVEFRNTGHGVGVPAPVQLAPRWPYSAALVNGRA